MTNQDPFEPRGNEGSKPKISSRKQRDLSESQSRTDGVAVPQDSESERCSVTFLDLDDARLGFPQFHECEFDEAHLEEPPVTIVVKAPSEDESGRKVSKMIIIGVLILFLGQIAINVVDSFMCGDEVSAEEVPSQPDEKLFTVSDHSHSWVGSTCLSCHDDPHQNIRNNLRVGAKAISDDDVNDTLTVSPTSP